jgi:hypothetical protein
MNLIEEAMVEHWGRRCPDFEPECACCKAWLEYDSLVKQPKGIVSTMTPEQREEAVAFKGSILSGEQIRPFEETQSAFSVINKVFFEEPGLPEVPKRVTHAMKAVIYERMLEKTLTRLVALRSALVFCGTAIDTGRSEPLFAARDVVRNSLEDDATMEKESREWT